MTRADDPVRIATILSVPEVAELLGITAGMLKLGIRSKLLSPPDVPGVAGFSVSGFTYDWVDRARPLVSLPSFKKLKYPDA